MTRKVPPNPARPRLSRRKERRLEAADEKSASGYDALEEATRHLAELAAEVGGEDEKTG